MNFKLSIRQSLFIITIAVIFLAVLIINFHLPKENFSVQPASIVTQANLNLPVRLKIPSINVDAPVEYVGLTQSGAMDVPQKPEDVAWYNLGPRPGESGSAAIAGHSGYKDNKPAVFDNLYKLQKGDKIYVEDSKGITVTFIVREFRTYGLYDDVSSVFNSNDGVAHLNLITCSGVWNDKEKTHATRLIVFTDLTL
jgi:LPXTG-site transpeptidase (sortase) family protein